MNKETLTRDMILDAAFAVFGRNASAGLADVATAAGLGRATLHRYFPSRADLMAALSARAVADLDAAVTLAIADATSQLDGLRRALVASIPLATRLLFLAQDNMIEDAASHEALRAAIEAAKRDGELPPHVPTDWIARLYDGVIYIAWEAVAAEELTPTQAAHLAWTSFLHGVKGAHL